VKTANTLQQTNHGQKAVAALFWQRTLEPIKKTAALILKGEREMENKDVCSYCEEAYEITEETTGFCGCCSYECAIMNQEEGI